RTSKELAEGFSEVHRKVCRKFTELAKKDQSLPMKLVGTRQDHREVRELIGSLQNGFRGFIGRPPEVRRKLTKRSLIL
ncbi:unnamed protein product, partial [Musa textilis]